MVNVLFGTVKVTFELKRSSSYSVFPASPHRRDGPSGSGTGPGHLGPGERHEVGRRSRGRRGQLEEAAGSC